MDGSPYFASGGGVSYATSTAASPASVAHPTAASAVPHIHPHHALAAHTAHPSHPSPQQQQQQQQQQQPMSHPHAHPVLSAYMHPMAHPGGWMQPTAAFMPAGPTMAAYGTPHGPMYGQWHPHSHPHMPHLVNAAAAAPQTAVAAAKAPGNNAAGNSNAHPLPANHSPFHSAAAPNASAAAASASASQSSASQLHSSLGATQRPIAQYAALASPSSTPAQFTATGKGKRLKAADNGGPNYATAALATPYPLAQHSSLAAGGGGMHSQPALLAGSVQSAPGGGYLSGAADGFSLSSGSAAGDLHTAEGRARLMADIRSMINERKRNDVKRRYLAMKDKLTALDAHTLALKQQLDATRQAEAQLAEKRQQLLDALMQYEGRRWIRQQQQTQQQPISSATGRWVLCGKRKDNNESCSHPVKKAKKGQSQKYCKHHQTRSGSAAA